MPAPDVNKALINANQGQEQKIRPVYIAEYDRIKGVGAFADPNKQPQEGESAAPVHLEQHYD